jgi:hypothetical protein
VGHFRQSSVRSLIPCLQGKPAFPLHYKSPVLSPTAERLWIVFCLIPIQSCCQAGVLSLQEPRTMFGMAGNLGEVHIKGVDFIGTYISQD